MSEKEKKTDYKNPKYYTNRELSWILFNSRVLNEARDKTIPLFERLKLDIAACGGTVREVEYGAALVIRAAFPAGGAESFVPRLTELSAGALEMAAAGEEYLPGPREE